MFDYFAFRLSDLNEKSRKQYSDLEHEYDNFRSKQLAAQVFLKSSEQQTKIPSKNTSKLSRSLSLNSSLNHHSTSASDCSNASNFFDLSSNILKSHLIEFKSRIQNLTIDCSNLTDRLHQSEEEKRYLIDRITLLERQRRDENDSFQNQLNHYEKFVNKHSNTSLSELYSPPEHELSLYDEVQFEYPSSTTTVKSSYEATNYKDLFARIYEKLKPTTSV